MSQIGIPSYFHLYGKNSCHTNQSDMQFGWYVTSEVRLQF